MFENMTFPKELKPSDDRFAPGPSLIPQSHMDALAKVGTSFMGRSHRKPVVKNLVKEMQEGLLKYFKAPSGYEVILGNGGATCLFDAMACSLIEKKSAHFVTGEFSSKWYKSSKLNPSIEAIEYAVDFGQGLTPKMIDGCDTICCTLNETSTGVIVDEFPAMSAEAILCVDATSGGGQVPCDISQTDFYFFSPQKVFASDGGLWVALISPKAKERIEKVCADKSRYIPPFFNLKMALDNGEKNQTYTTPALATLFLLNEQVKLMNQVGYDAVIADGNKKAELIYGWANEKDYLTPYVAEEKFRSNAVATIDVDDKYDVAELLKIFEKEGIAHGINSYRKLGRNQFRIALFYNIKFDDLEKLTKLISHAIESV